MLVYRICKERWGRTAIDGEGARLNGGRWSPKGTLIAYCSESLSLAQLDVLVNFDPMEPPEDYVYVEAMIPDDVKIEELDVAALPEDWRRFPAPDVLGNIGWEWAESRRTLVLEVPTTVDPIGKNYLINPLHAEFDKVVMSEPTALAFDRRLRPPSED